MGPSMLIVAAVLIGFIVGWWLRGRLSGELTVHRVPPRPLPAPGPELEAEVRALLMAGQKIAAIKLFREATGCGLKEAKEAVEEMKRRGSEGALE